MLSISAITGIVTGGSQIISGIGKYREAGKMTKIQNRMAEAQYSYNKKEIARAFEKNYMNLMDQYTESRKAMIDQATQSASIQNVINNNNNNVDKEFNSYKVDSINALDSQLFSNINKLISEQVFNMGELASERASQDLQNASIFTNTLTNISNQKIQARGQAISQMVKGGTRAGSSAIGGIMGAKDTGAIDTVSSSIASFGYQPLSLKYFGGK